MEAADVIEGARVKVTALMQSGYVDSNDGRHIVVVLDNGDQFTLAAGSGQVTPTPFTPGDRVVQSDGTEGVVTGRDIVGGLPVVHVWFDGQVSRIIERNLRPADINDPVDRFEAGRIDLHDDFNLRSVAADLWIHNHSERFVSLSHAQFDLMPHQVGVLHRVMEASPHRFLLCDEVGLGKTIEAAMVIKELRSRGQAERILIICPANLQRQWQFELKTKFNEAFRIFNRATLNYLRNEERSNPWTTREAASVITSHAFASHNEDRRRQISAAPWDLIIVDEAHHARRRRQGRRVEQTNLYRLVRDLTADAGLDRRSVLFLTATPMQLQYHELFSLVELLNHTLFPSEEDFRDHVDSRSNLIRLMSDIESDPTADASLERYAKQSMTWLKGNEGQIGHISNADDLLGHLRGAHKLNEVMLRNRRASVGGFMPRTAKIWDVELDSREQEAQRQMQAIISDGHRAASMATGRGANAIGFLMTIYQKLAASSSRALLASLEGRRQRLLEAEREPNNTASLDPESATEQLEDDELSRDVTSHLDPAVVDEADRIGEVIDLLRGLDVDSKAQVLVNNLRHIYYDEENPKVIIFTEFRETQDMLRELLTEEGWKTEVFHGQMKPFEKDQAIIRFRDGVGAQALVSTEAGGEGRNLQFANILIHYDLPWNPMKVEQRIGRIDRIGQTREIMIFNFRVIGTIEERILEVLHDRIGMFENAIGGLEPILGTTEDDIRKAMSEAIEKRDAALQSVGQQLERKISQARQADEQFKHLYFDASEYQDEIKRLIGKAQEIPRFSQKTVDKLLERLLHSVNASVTPPGDGTKFPIGQRRIEFHPPFTEQEQNLLDANHRRLVCFDPTQPVESSDVEYFGFGHPIVNALIRRATQEVDSGKATIRQLPSGRIPNLRPGWQFNWRFRLHDASQGREWLRPFFIDDRLETDETLAADLLRVSQAFLNEGLPLGATADPVPDSLSDASRLAERFAVQFANQLESEQRAQAVDTYDVTRARLERLYEIKIKAAQERLESSQKTLERMHQLNDPTQRQVIPIWEFNVRRSRETIEHLQRERLRELRELEKARDPNIEYELLNVARIEVRT